MSEQNAAELCTLLINDIYGEVSAKVCGALQLGRMQLPQLCQHTQLPYVTIKQTLVVLIQQHLVVYYTNIDGGREAVWYECQWSQAYELIHAGRIIRVIEERFGEDGALLISNMLQMGHVKVSDFLAAYGVLKKKTVRRAKTEETNGDNSIPSDVAKTPVGTMKTVLAGMLKERFLIEVKNHHMHPATDIENTLRKEVKAQLATGSMSELKLTKEVDEKVQEKLRELANGDPSEHAGMKRKAGQSGGRAKKKRKISMYDAEDEEIEWEIDESVVLRVNYEKFIVLYRNAELVSLAETRLGKVTSQVYSELLKHLEPRYLRCKNTIDNVSTMDADGPCKKIKISTLELSRNFDEEIDLHNSIGSIPVEEKPSKTKKRGHGANGPFKRHANGDDDSDDASDASEEVDEWAEDHDDLDENELDHEAKKNKKRMEIMKEHLQLLAEDSVKFLTSEGNRGMGEWSVNYKELGKYLRGLEVEKIVEERFQRQGLRLLRVLKDKGKLDEKQIANIALLKQKEIRSILSRLHEAGHLELQEVPKSHPPQVQRTYFLWYHDEDRASANLLSDVYKAMSRNIQRTNEERDRRAQLLEKSERTDVQENYEEYMSSAEKRELEVWRNREEKLLGQLMRLDRMIMILRDY